jgi:hypothetical protein
MTEVCASRSMQPNTSITTIMGKSQNFFLEYRKVQNSSKKVISFLLKLLSHGTRRRARWPPVDPIALHVGFEPETKRIFTTKPHQKARRCEYQIEQKGRHYRVYDSVEEHPQAGP